jgi:hypothetical protein
MVHRELLATKELCAELNEVMDAVIETVNYIKTHPLKNRHLQNYASNEGAVSVLFYWNSRWMSRRNVVVRVYNLREVALYFIFYFFLENENLVHAQQFRNEYFVS